MKRLLSTSMLALSAASIGFLVSVAPHASAKPPTVFMLQFGSFESQEEADARLKTLKTKHSGLVGPLSSRVLEVGLPDSLTVYRTQAGPVPSRAEAQSVCAQLASQGDECYVVETAMVQQPAVAKAKPVPAAKEAEKKEAAAQPASVSTDAKAKEAKAETKVTAALPATPAPKTEIVAPQPPKLTTTPGSALKIIPNPNIQASLPKSKLNEGAKQADAKAPEKEAALVVEKTAEKTAVAEAAIAEKAEAPAKKTDALAAKMDEVAATPATQAAPQVGGAVKKPVVPMAQAVPLEARRDPRNRESLAKLGAAGNELESAPETSLHAVPAQSEAKSSTAAAQPVMRARPKKKEASLWDDINPFSDDEEEEELEIVRPAETKIAPAKEAAAARLAAQAGMDDSKAAQSDTETDIKVDAKPVAKPVVSQAPKETPVIGGKPVAKPASAEAAKPEDKPELKQEAKATPVEAEAKPVVKAAPAPAPQAPAPEVLPSKPMTKEEALRLPPPPPLTEESRRIFEQNRREMPLATAPQNAQATPAKVSVTEVGTPMMRQEQLKAPAPVAAAPFAKAGEKPVIGGNGNVKVEEAKRVPLTEAQQAALPAGAKMYVPSGSNVAPADASIDISPKAPPRTTGTPGLPKGELASPAVALPPSTPVMGKTQWADIGKFSSPQKALEYWERFRKAQPDFPVVRVRVVQTYAEKVNNTSEVTLRVGPFSKPQSIDYLCKHLGADNLTCKPVTDTGTSGAATDGRLRALQGEANLATQELLKDQAAVKPVQGQYWLQLGSYPSLAQAQNNWGDIQKRHGMALTGLQPNIAVPALTSASRPTYRLRAGPFATELAANQACMRMKSSGGTCLVSTQ